MNKYRSNERGSSRLQFLVVMAVIGCVVYAGYLYIPVSYQAYAYKDTMQHFVDVASTQGFTPAWVAEQLVKVGPEYEVPPNAIITPVAKDNRMEVRVQFNRPIDFPGYTYEYQFDQTVKSTAFLVIK
jgi:hypothetical protein